MAPPAELWYNLRVGNTRESVGMGTFITVILVLVAIGVAVTAFVNTEVGEGCCLGVGALLMLAGVGGCVLLFGLISWAGCSLLT